MAKKPRKNDPVRARRARWRALIALALAFAALAFTDFGFVKLARGPAPMAEAETLAPGDYVRQDVGKILGNIATGYRGEKATEVYVVVPLSSRLYVFCFPQRWFASELALREKTDAWLEDMHGGFDDYVLVTGTVGDLPENVAAELKTWLAEREDGLRQYGQIPAGVAAEDCVAPCVVYVDRVGRQPFGTVILLSALALALTLYALVVLLRLALRGYGAKKKDKTKKKPKEARHAKA